MNDTKNKYYSCLLGGAIADSLGSPIEFLSFEDIKKKYGNDGVTKYESAYGVVGGITDDTQMTLFTAEGLLRTFIHNKLDNKSKWSYSLYKLYLTQSYQRWLETQGVNLFCERPEVINGRLITYKELHNRRAPGNTCITTLINGEADMNSKGCGTVMRVAPIGLFCRSVKMSMKDSFNLGIVASEITHGHITGTLSGGFLSAMIYALIDHTIKDSIVMSIKILKTYQNYKETLNAVETSINFAQDGKSIHELIESIGYGNTAESALGLAIYSCLTTSSFDDAIIKSVNHSGDSDSVGIIAGSIAGLMYDFMSLDNKWIDNLELRSVIYDIAGDLYDCRDWDVLECKIQSDKYPNNI